MSFLRSIFSILSVNGILFTCSQSSQDCKYNFDGLCWKIPERKITPSETPRGMMIYIFCYHGIWLLRSISRLGYQSREGIRTVLSWIETRSTDRERKGSNRSRLSGFYPFLFMHHAFMIKGDRGWQ